MKLKVRVVSPDLHEVELEMEYGSENHVKCAPAHMLRDLVEQAKELIALEQSDQVDHEGDLGAITVSPRYHP